MNRFFHDLRQLGKVCSIIVLDQIIRSPSPEGLDGDLFISICSEDKKGNVLKIIDDRIGLRIIQAKVEQNNINISPFKDRCCPLHGIDNRQIKRKVSAGNGLLQRFAALLNCFYGKHSLHRFPNP